MPDEQRIAEKLKDAGAPTPDWVSGCGTVVLYNADCLEVLPELPDGVVDACVSDPPYGMNANLNSKRFSGGQRQVGRGEGRSDWTAIAGDDRPFDPTPFTGFPQVILWGANHYATRLQTGTTLIWIKKADHLFGTFLSDCEVAWQKGGCGVYAFRKQFPPPSRMAEHDGTVAHPTQKPISLMEWCISRCKCGVGTTVLEPFLGSGTTGVAAARLDRQFIGIEIDENYFKIARDRIQQELTRMPLFDPPTPPNSPSR